MLRVLLLLALMAANGWMWAWGQGFWGPAPGQGQREPERLNTQVHPERLKLIEPKKAEALRKAPPLCRLLGPFADDAAWQAAEATLTTELNLPAGQWAHETHELPAQWGLLTRAATSAVDLERKRSVVERALLKPQNFVAPQEQSTSLLLSRHDSEAAAETELNRLHDTRNLRGLRVLQLRGPQTQHWLRVLAWPANKLQAKHEAWGGVPQPCRAKPVQEPAAAAAASTASGP